MPRLCTDEVADVLQTVRIRVVHLLERRGLLGHADDAQLELCANELLADSEPALARLAHTALGTEPPSGPEVRRRHADVSLAGRPGFTVAGSLCVAEHDFRCTPPRARVRTTRLRASASSATCCVHRWRPSA